MSARRPLPLCFAIAALISLISGNARAQWGAASSLYTEDGVEVSVDARVFGLFALLNGLGYDVERDQGPAPLFRPRFSPMREELRGRTGRLGPSYQAMRQIVADHPVPARAYVEAVLALGPSPRFEAAEDAPALVRALSGAVRAWFNEEGGASTMAALVPLASATQKKLADELNAACRKMNAFVRLGSDEDQLLDDAGPAGRVVVTLNELDAHASLAAFSRGEVVTLVAGPQRGDDDAQAVLRAATLAYARTRVSREVAKVPLAPVWAEGQRGLSGAARAALADGAALATEVLSCALMRQVFPGGACSGSPLASEHDPSGLLESVRGRIAAGNSDDPRPFAEVLIEWLAATAPTAPTAPALPRK